ncbi:hypothetical protein OTU49_001916, partial [Cherax quadricarinatus]
TGFTAVFLMVLTVFTSCTSGRVRVRGIFLTKGGQQQHYMNLGADDLNYQLECRIEGSTSHIVNVTWTLDNWGVVYTWVAATRSVTVNLPLKEHVKVPWEGVEVGPDIHFISPDVSMRGLYKCSVYHTSTDVMVNPVWDEYDLQMYAFFQGEYNISASVEKCTMYWSFSTPRMYPRPEVHCGFWNRTGHLVKELRGGLVFHQDVNYVWYVYARNTPVQVADIPRGTSFHCSTQVSIANYTKHTHLDEESIAQLLHDRVNDEGCPALPTLRNHMDVILVGCRYNCRGECHQYSSKPVIAEYRCDPGYWSYWETKNIVVRRWSLRVTCYDSRRIWVSEDGTKPLDLPYCIYSGSAVVLPCSVQLLVVVAILSWQLT